MLFDPQELKILGSTFSITYPRFVEIRRKSNEVEDGLMGKYLPPAVIPTPDEIEPSMPRIVANSINGNSQITFSQISANLNVKYSSEYQKNYSLGNEYLNERIEMIIKTMHSIGIKRNLYTGLVSNIHFPKSDANREIINHLLQKFSNPNKVSGKINEYLNKFTFILDEKYYVNLTIGNYRNYNIEEVLNISPLPDDRSIESGVFVNLDINNRYQFNSFEKETIDVYKSAQSLLEVTKNIIENKLILFLNEGVIEI